MSPADSNEASECCDRVVKALGLRGAPSLTGRRAGVYPQPVGLSVRQTVSGPECTSHSQLLSGLATKIKGDYCCLYPRV